MTDVRDKWAAGSTYEEFMGRWSRLLAPRFVSWLRIPRGVHWLDVGCGTGALANAICSHGDPASVIGCDSAEPFIEFARDHSRDARVSFVVAGVGSLPRRRGGYGSVTSLFALTGDVAWNHTSEFICGNRAVTEWHRTATLKTGAKQSWLGCDLYTFRSGLIVMKDTYVKVVL